MDPSCTPLPPGQQCLFPTQRNGNTIDDLRFLLSKRYQRYPSGTNTCRVISSASLFEDLVHLREKGRLLLFPNAGLLLRELQYRLTCGDAIPGP